MKIILTLLMAFIAFPAMAAEDTNMSENKLKIVESKYICMVNDSVFDKEQIAVQVDDKTYYGCCSMCEERLKKDEKIRKAIDPVSGNSVDKAEAVIAVDPSHKVYYFESKQTMQKYAHKGTHDHANHKMKMSDYKNAVMGKGIVHSVDVDNNTLNLTHEAIPELKWPEMTMDLAVTENVNLEDLKSDQNIHFHIELGEDKVYRITKIMTPETADQCEVGKDCPMHDDMPHGASHKDDHGSHHGDHH